MPKSAQKGQAKGQPRYSAPAAEKGFAVIELLAAHHTGLTLSEIAAGLGLSVSEIFRIIVVMERRGWLRKSSDDRYAVTPLVLQFAFKATRAEELSALLLPHMRALAAASDQSCHLVIRSGERGLVIARQQNPGPTGFHVRIGAEIDLGTSASGHVLLAFQHSANLRPPVAAERSLATVLSAVRQRGYERMESPRVLGVTDISYPLFDMHGDVLAALTVPFLRVIDGTQQVSLDQTQALLEDTARRVSGELGVKQGSLALQD